MDQALIILMIVISIILIVIVYLQSGKVKNVGSAIIGSQDVELFEYTKHRGTDKFLHILTIVMVGLFLLFAFLLLFL